IRITFVERPGQMEKVAAPAARRHRLDADFSPHRRRTHRSFRKRRVKPANLAAKRRRIKAGCSNRYLRHLVEFLRNSRRVSESRGYVDRTRVKARRRSVRLAL